MKVSKGQSQPETVAASFLVLYMVLGSPMFVPIGFVCDSCVLFPRGLEQQSETSAVPSKSREWSSSEAFWGSVLLTDPKTGTPLIYHQYVCSSFGYGQGPAGA